jgi:predicted nuclease with RNAse H fold
MTLRMKNSHDIAVAGIDVGGSKKGCHLVILRGREIVKVAGNLDAHAMHAHCVAEDVALVGIDAPCKWGVQGGVQGGGQGTGRAAEREMARQRIACFSTPTQARAQESAFYEWMINGERVYRAFAPSHPLLCTNRYEGAPAAFETFPHAITCALLGRGAVSAKDKRVQRRDALGKLGFDIARFRSIDDLDAALCAYAAQCLMDGDAHAYGDADGGFIFVPA